MMWGRGGRGFSPGQSQPSKPQTNIWVWTNTLLKSLNDNETSLWKDVKDLRKCHCSCSTRSDRGKRGRCWTEKWRFFSPFLITDVQNGFVRQTPISPLCWNERGSSTSNQCLHLTLWYSFTLIILTQHSKIMTLFSDTRFYLKNVILILPYRLILLRNQVKV